MSNLLLLLAQSASPSDEAVLSNSVKWWTFFALMIVFGIVGAFQKKK